MRNSETVLVFVFRSRGVAFVAFVGVGVGVADVDVDVELVGFVGACACESAEEEEEEEGDANPSLREKKSRIFPWWWWWWWWWSPSSRFTSAPSKAVGASAGADGVPGNSELLAGPNSSSIWLLGQAGCEVKVEWVMNHVRERKEMVGGSHSGLEAA